MEGDTTAVCCSSSFCGGRLQWPSRCDGALQGVARSPAGASTPSGGPAHILASGLGQTAWLPTCSPLIQWPPDRLMMHVASHKEGLETSQSVGARAKMPCVRSHVSPSMSASSDPKTYIRTYIRDTFGYIRIHSGNFEYIRTEADHSPTHKNLHFNDVRQNGGIHSPHEPLLFIILKRKCYSTN